LASRIAHGLLNYGLVPFAYYFIRAYLSLLRLRVEKENPVLDHIAAGGKVVAAVWHQRFLSALVYASRHREFNPCVMISQSKDGDLIAPVVARLGLDPVRGSSSRGGSQALKTMVRALGRNPAAVHIVDGPRGPKGHVKNGVITLAQLTGAGIFPLFISTEKNWRARSWDRFMVPKPFTRVLIRWGEPFYVPRKSGPQALEEIRRQVEQALNEGHARDDLAWGWDRPL